MSILNKIFKSYNDRELNKLEKIANKVEKLDKTMQQLSDSELQAKTAELKEKLAKGKTLNDILPEAFAVVREAAFRTLNMKPFHVQLIGGIVLHQGRIAEMKTGEGKTLVATLPAYLNALTGKGVYIITVNEYLAKTQMEQMSKLFGFLGLTTGCILHEMSNETKKEQYKCDIVYATNNELGFDYLRDNMVLSTDDIMQVRRDFAIIDEVDSILIDEARTPLIISGKAENATKFYVAADKFAKMLKPEVDYTFDEKMKVATLTDEGIKKAEKFFKIDNLADTSSLEVSHYVVQALKANYGLKKDRDYIVSNNEVLIVDEFTGRVMPGRRYSDGLHQAIEAKENVKIKAESKTYATITLQNYFKLYKKISGMTGTAKTEQDEFRDIYRLDVVVIPTNKPVKRNDRKDLVYKNKALKYKAIINDIAKSYEKGQPVLVGTTSVEKSETLSKLLKKEGIPHQVLNAKHLEQEAEIISHAGEKGKVTIATNMAGRGTDIKLEEGVEKLGGLKVIGTERQESRRVDNQLRGRSGRQGDVGESIFYVSLEDDLMRIFAKEKVDALIKKLDKLDTDVIENSLVSKAIVNAQKAVEGNNFDSRKRLIRYDNIINIQREMMYKQRNEVLLSDNVQEYILNMIKEYIDELVDRVGSDTEELITNLKVNKIIDEEVTIEELDKLETDELKEFLYYNSRNKYARLEKNNGVKEMRYIEKILLLKIVDRKWISHLNNMDFLKQGIGLRSYGQHDPVQVYTVEGQQMFNQMIDEIKEDVVKLIFSVVL